MHCEKCSSRETETSKCPKCRQTAYITCKACGHTYCSDRFCEVIALKSKITFLTRLAILLLAAMVVSVPSTMAVLTGQIEPDGPKITPPPPARTAQAPQPQTPPTKTPAEAPPETAPVRPPAEDVSPPPPPPADAGPPPPDAGGSEGPPPTAGPPPEDTEAASLSSDPEALEEPELPEEPEEGQVFIEGEGPTFEDLRKRIEGALGIPYKKKGTSIEEGGVGLAGFPHFIYKEYGVDLPLDLEELRQMGVEVDPSGLQPGDVLLYSIKKNDKATFAGVYAGDDKFAYPYPKKRMVIKGSVNQKFFKQRFLSARRFTRVQ